MAQIALVLLTLWMLLSSLWSPWREASVGEGIRQGIWTAWALVLGRTLSRRGVRRTGLAMVAVLLVAAGLGLWYRHERSPFMRLEFPIGNPLFMAACLLSGLALAGFLLFGVFAETMDRSHDRKTALAQLIAGTVRDMGGWWLVIGAVVGLAVMARAFWLTESEGPQWALVAGAAAAVWLVSARLVRWVLPIAIIVALAVLIPLKLPSWKADPSKRFRYYAACYAGDLFMQAPIIGQGQGSYMLVGQSMMSADMEKDPAAFSGSVLDHTHNEYLQIAAELGLVGIVLSLLFLVMTFWAAVSAWPHAKTPLDQWVLAGLLAAFTAIAVEEVADVGLRKAGLPAIYYTTIGLIWAFSLRLLTTEQPVVRRQSDAVRVAGLVAGIVAVMGIGSSAWRDWEGALAAYQVKELVDKQEWDASMTAARTAVSRRLAVDDFVEAYFNTARAALQASSYQVERCKSLAARLDADAPARANTIRLITDDRARFEQYARTCENAAQALLSLIRGYPRVAWILADLQMLRQQMESIEQQTGLRKDVHNYMELARGLYELELSRDPQDLATALRVIGLTRDQPVTYRLDLLRKPLRRGPIPLQPSAERFSVDLLGELEPVILSILDEPGFSEAIMQMRDRGQQAMAVRDVSAWEDPYAPESLRLVARVEKLAGNFPGAVELAGQAAELSKKLGEFFPGAVSNARLDESRYLLIAFPQEAGRAVAACDQAIKEWPNVRERDLQLRPVWQTRAMYMLAADSEQETRDLLGKLYPRGQAGLLDRRVSDGYTELCHVFVAFPSQARPPTYARWVDRAMQLSPENRSAHLLAARLAFDQGDKAVAVDHLKLVVDLSFAANDDASGIQYLRVLAQLAPDPALLADVISQISQKHPGNTTLKKLVEAGPGALLPPASAPASSQSQPSSTAEAG